MPPQNRRIVTLRDVTTTGMGSETGSPTTRSPHQQPKLAPASSAGAGVPDYCQPIHSTDNPNIMKTPIPLHHIPTLSNAQRCAEMLQRIHREFAPIIQRRGYKVISISELCCCGDGLDHVTGRDGRRRKKLRKQSNNVWGYNQTRFFRGQRSSTSHTIHLRLRHPCTKNGQSGRFFEWEDVAGTMAHEMAHCIHQNHSPAFYKLMEEILDEHATNQVPGGAFASFGQPLGGTATTPNSATPFTTDSGQRLGGGSKNDSGTGRSRLLNEANVGGRKLGGGTALTSPTSRRNVIARAAESRKRLMAQTRIRISRTREPCVVELLDDDDDDVITPDASDSRTEKPSSATGAGPSSTKRTAAHDFHTAGASRSLPSNKKPKASTANKNTTDDGDDGNVVDLTTPSPKKNKQDAIGENTGPASSGMTSTQFWICTICTLQNRPLVLVCEACLKHRY